MGARLLAQTGGSTLVGDGLAAGRLLLRPGGLTKGHDVREFERLFAECVGAQHGFSFWASRVGLYGLLKSLGVGPGNEVLIQAPTHVVVANAIRMTGARPVYVDCTRESYNIDFDQAERRITPQAKALVLQHTFGIPAHLDDALEFVGRHGLALIEDCVHALGSTYRGRPVGTFGDGAIFSTEATKTISTAMGGIAVTNDGDVATRMERFQAGCSWPAPSLTARRVVKFALTAALTGPRVYRVSDTLYRGLRLRRMLPSSHAADEEVGRRPPGYEERMSNAQAALGLRQLRRLESNLGHRRLIAAVYAEELARRGLAVPVPPAEADPVYLRYPVWAHDRAAAIRVARPILRLGTWFTSVLQDAASPEAAGYERGSCPVAEQAAQHLVNLPTHEKVRTKDALATVEALASVLAVSRPVVPAEEGRAA